MEETKELKEKTKSYMQEYYEKYGIGGLLGIIIELEGEKVDKEDIEKHRAAVELERQATGMPRVYFDTPNIDQPIQHASIYAEEHIPAVQEDLVEHSQNPFVSENLSQPKTKVLENKSVPLTSTSPVETMVRPNPWGDAKMVVPGEIKETLTR